MSFFGKKSEGGMLDVIRCDQEDYLIWKWSPSGTANSTNKENAIRWGSSLRVKDGEVAVFVYKQKDGSTQDFIEGPFDETIKTGNFPVISNIIGLAYAGKSPFQAEVYYINLAGNQKMPFGVPYFDVFDNRFLDFPVRMSARGSIIFNITDYRGFIKLHRLVNFDFERLKSLVRDAVVKYVKGIIVNAPADNGIPVLQIERKLLEINDLIKPRVAQAFQDDFGVNLVRFDLDTIEVDKNTDEYRELRQITANLETQMRVAQNETSIKNMREAQAINAENLEATLAIEREERQRFQRLQTETQHLAAHQINQQAAVLRDAANNLGEMAYMGGGSGSGGGGFNPAGMMTGMALGGIMGGQMTQMAGQMNQNIQTQMSAPPPPPQAMYSVNVNGQTLGPYSIPQLQELVRTGQINMATYVWKPGMANWEILGNVPELAHSFAPPPPPPP
ncbi:SPFH domain-containing protein, partial [Zoogloea sp.]|uniref:SPFH domain-containing protein n=1 Tax=Zoogloea sp. TaxID=49181 RepID=UPI001415DD7D